MSHFCRIPLLLLPQAISLNFFRFKTLAQHRIRSSSHFFLRNLDAEPRSKLIEKVNLFGVIGKVLSTLGDTTQEQKYLNDLYN